MGGFKWKKAFCGPVRLTTQSREGFQLGRLCDRTTSLYAILHRFFFKEEIMTIRTIGDFKKKLVMQLALEVLKVATSNYDGGVTFYKNSGASTRRIRQPTRTFLEST